MAGLMTKTSVEYSSLANSYNDFQVPAVRVKIDGKQYSSVTAKETKKGHSLLIEKMDAYLYHGEGSSVSILIGDAYDIQGSQFKETVSLGNSIRVEVGYGSVFEEIFSGYIGEIQLEYHGTNQQIRITALDAVSLMSQNYRSIYYTEKKYSDIVSSIIENYSNVVSAGNIDDTGEKVKNFLSRCGMNDYEYINNILCPLAKKEFYIFNGKAYFQSVKKREQSHSVSLRLGQSLFDFKLTTAYANFETRVSATVGSDPANTFLGTAVGKTDSSQKSAVSAVQKQFFSFWSADDSESTNACASYWLQQNIAKRQTAEGLCIGLPEIVPGRCIKINGIQKGYNNKKFWIDSVHHKIDNSGFTTKFTVKGWS